MPTVMGDMQSIMRPRRMVRFLSRVCCPLVHKLSDLKPLGRRDAISHRLPEPASARVQSTSLSQRAGF